MRHFLYLPVSILMISTGLAYAQSNAVSQPLAIKSEADPELVKKGWLKWADPTKEELEKTRSELKETIEYSMTWTPDNRFIARGDEIYDTRTKLTWKRCTAGMTWNGKACIGAPAKISLEEAFIQYHTPQKGWRLPNLTELQTIRSGSRCEDFYSYFPEKCSQMSDFLTQQTTDRPLKPEGVINPAINLNVFSDSLVLLNRGQALRYWSAELIEYPAHAYYVDFYSGDVWWFDPTEAFVRLVKR